MQKTPPPPVQEKIRDEGEATAFIPYPDLGDQFEHVPLTVRPDVFYYQARMGFLPNTIKLYLHTPWIAEHLFRLNNAIMRDERNQLDEHLKYRLSIIASRDNGCEYCTAHHVNTLKQRWGYNDDEVQSVLRHRTVTDEREKTAIEFVSQASLDPTTVSDEQRQRLTQQFTPAEVMEIVQVVGFWKMYNTMHSAMAAPLEDPVLAYSDWVQIQPD
jgi:uncharacterized peroxidase-related enzyme